MPALAACAHADRAGEGNVSEAFGQQRGADLRVAHLVVVGDPQQFEEGIMEEETAVLGALAWMAIARSLAQAEGAQQLGLRRAGAGADEQVMLRYDAASLQQ